MDTLRRLLTAAELAKDLRLSASTLRLWARTGRIPVVRLSSRALRFEPDEVRAALVRSHKDGQRAS